MQVAKAQTSLRIRGKSPAPKLPTYTMKVHAVAVNLKSVKPLRWLGQLEFALFTTRL